MDSSEKGISSQSTSSHATNTRTVPELPDGWQFVPKIRTDGETVDLYWKDPSGQRYRTITKVREEFERLGIPFKSKQMSSKEIRKCAASSTTRRKDSQNTQNTEKNEKKERPEKKSTPEKEKRKESESNPKPPQEGKDGRGEKEKQAAKKKKRHVVEDSSEASANSANEANENVADEESAAQDRAAEDKSLEEEEDAPPKNKKKEKLDEKKSKSNKSSRKDEKEASTAKPKRKATDEPQSPQKKKQKAASSLAKGSDASADTKKITVSLQKHKQDAASAVSSPDVEQKAKQILHASEMLIGPRIGSLMRMNSSGEWVVTIIGQHTIQVAGPHPGENGSWYTVRPATAIKDIPLQNYMYKFHVGSEFVTPSVHHIKKSVGVGQIELIYQPKN